MPKNIPAVSHVKYMRARVHEKLRVSAKDAFL